MYKEVGMKGHNGIDFVTRHGEPIYFNCVDLEGTVLNHHVDSAGGIGIDVIVKDKDGKIYKLRYWHLIKEGFMSKVGKVLSTGDLVGYADNTGRSSGDHLHWGVKPQIIDKNGSYRNELPGNGYWGGIDPDPFFKNVYIKDYMYLLTETLNVLQKLIYLIKLRIGEIIDLIKVVNKK